MSAWTVVAPVVSAVLTVLIGAALAFVGRNRPLHRLAVIESERALFDHLPDGSDAKENMLLRLERSTKSYDYWRRIAPVRRAIYIAAVLGLVGLTLVSADLALTAQIESDDKHFDAEQWTTLRNALRYGEAASLYLCGYFLFRAERGERRLWSSVIVPPLLVRAPHDPDSAANVREVSDGPPITINSVMGAGLIVAVPVAALAKLVIAKTDLQDFIVIGFAVALAVQAAALLSAFHRKRALRSGPREPETPSDEGDGADTPRSETPTT